MDFLNPFFRWVMKKRIPQIELFMKYPHAIQNDIFNELVGKARNTEFGKKFGFKELKNNYNAFKERVPISSYEEFFPYIERQLKGEQNIIWPTEIRWFSKSSGTTNAKSKFIPVSPEALEDCHFKAGKDMLSLYVRNYPDTRLFTGKSVSIGGSHQPNPYDLFAKSHFGDVSAVIMQNLPYWAQFYRTPSLEIALMSEFEQKMERMAKETAHQNVTSISGVPTWTIVLLEKVMEYRGKNNILDIWPNLEVFFHGAVAFQPYRELFKTLIPTEKMHYMETYNASEGFFGIQDQATSNEMLLMLDYGVFYEFIPLEDMEKEDPKCLRIDEVELGKTYAVIISTNAGLWRYNLGDTVKFTSLFPYRIKISGRTKQFINAFGEELMVENAETAITQACQLTGAVIQNFTAGPIYLEEGKKGGHEWIVEFVKEPESLEVFTKILDEKLQEINSDYEAKRYKDMALLSPLVHNVPVGTFYQWMKKRGKVGGQHKVPRLANNREYLGDLLQMIKN
ncbi:GH3 auxin-responsive promoter family protein [Xanthovirga aplysinae]|uniref:GH3 auxin-responsive promoter family protein n=1 Tax=Xanthovirga aplysinae TaxID=2529853 RepID=UPI0012BB81BB|nr:GH3 auxin-responsive promoter family protein [Xanthovirga aplysinae]MTI31686.1 GH3 auxin-responsive promoter family protein [Xanthovirga aplysinae]